MTKRQLVREVRVRELEDAASQIELGLKKQWGDKDWGPIRRGMARLAKEFLQKRAEQVRLGEI